MAKHTIRDAVLADAEGIARVRVETWRVAYQGGQPVREKPVEIGPQTLIEVGYGFKL